MDFPRPGRRESWGQEGRTTSWGLNLCLAGFEIGPSFIYFCEDVHSAWCVLADTIYCQSTDIKDMAESEILADLADMADLADLADMADLADLADMADIATKDGKLNSTCKNLSLKN